VNWLTSSVMVKKISDLTLEQWLNTFDSLFERDKELRKQMAATTVAKSSSRSKK
jgi:hypothetical protein